MASNSESNDTFEGIPETAVIGAQEKYEIYVENLSDINVISQFGSDNDVSLINLTQNQDDSGDDDELTLEWSYQFSGINVDTFRGNPRPENILDAEKKQIFLSTT